VPPRLFTPVPNVVKLAVQGTSSDLRWENVLHYVYGGAPPSLPSVTGLAEAMFNEYVDAIIPLTSDDASIDQVVVTDLSSSSSNVGTYGTATPGSAGGETLPASVAVLASYPVTLRYKGGHPRSYIFAGVQADLQDQSNWTSAFITEITDAWGNFIATPVGDTISGTTYTSQCAVSYRSADAYRETPVVMPITGFTILAPIASQRRRMRRRS
jgi:hypothetical protein